jgi:hypothetical protein
MGLLYERAGRLNTKNAGFRPEQWRKGLHEGTEPVVMTPWGSVARPHILDPDAVLGVRISTACNMTSDCTLRSWARLAGDWLELHVSTDGHSPSPAHTGQHGASGNKLPGGSGPLAITVDREMQNASAPHEGVTVRAAGFGGRSGGQLFAESSSVFVFRTIKVVDLPKPRLCVSAAHADYRPIYYLSSQHYCGGTPCDVRVATVNATYSYMPFSHLPGNHGQGWNLTMRNMSAGTGCHPGVRGCTIKYGEAASTNVYNLKFTGLTQSLAQL